jgi:O-antigen/teichoic acid export membrane protein
MVPVSVVGMVLSAPVLEAWLGPEFREGAAAMAILLALWLPYAASGVLIAVLVAAGRAALVARYAWAVAAASVVLALVLIPPLELEGAALAATLPSTVVVPFLLRPAVAAAGIGVGAVLREAALPAYALGAALAAVLGAARLLLDVEGVAAVVACAVGGAALYWAAFYGLVMRPGEREFVRSLVSARRR